MQFGIYRREESPTRRPDIAVEQVRSGEVWGREHRLNGLLPQVKAYVGPLAPDRRGIEFTTEIAPEWRSSSIFEHRWYYPNTIGVQLRQRAGIDYACITAIVVNKQP